MPATLPGLSKGQFMKRQRQRRGSYEMPERLSILTKYMPILRPERQSMTGGWQSVWDAIHAEAEARRAAREARKAEHEMRKAETSHKIHALPECDTREAKAIRELAEDLERDARTAAMAADVPTIQFPEDDEKYYSARKYGYV